MARAVAVLALLALAGCGSMERLAVRQAVAICPEAPPSIVCPGEDGELDSLADVFAALGRCRARDDAWLEAHRACRERLEARE